MRLNENHPTMIKIRKLEQLASELGITLSVGYDQQIRLTDDDCPDKEFQYRDVEQSFYGRETTTTFPYHCETKIIYPIND